MTHAALPPSTPDLRALSQQAPASLTSAVGVLVEEQAPSGQGSFVIKICCRDRHGLLADVTSALSTLHFSVNGGRGS
jgi:hypothetical protein